MRIKAFSLTVLATLTIFSSVQAGDPNSPVLAKIGTADASKHYGETLIVTGKVVQVTVRPNLVFINFDQAYPHSPFTSVIFSRNTNQFTNQFSNLMSLKGKNVEVTGLITNYQNKPEMVLTNARQLTLSAIQPAIEVQTNAPAPK